MCIVNKVNAKIRKAELLLIGARDVPNTEYKFSLADYLVYIMCVEFLVVPTCSTYTKRKNFAKLHFLLITEHKYT